MPGDGSQLACRAGFPKHLGSGVAGVPPYAITRSLRPGNGLFIKILQVLESRILGLLSYSLIKYPYPKAALHHFVEHGPSLKHASDGLSHPK